MSFGKPETEEVEEEEELSPGMLQIMATLDQQEKRFVTSPLFPFPQGGGVVGYEDRGLIRKGCLVMSRRSTQKDGEHYFSILKRH